MHFFGSEVRRAREAACMSQTELGDLVPCDKATVSRIEAGLTQPDQAFARACDATFPRPDGWFTRFYAGSRTWGEAFPPAFRPFAACESEAVALRWFEHSLVPGLLQTEDYARAVLEPTRTRQVRRSMNGSRPGWQGRPCSIVKTRRSSGSCSMKRSCTARSAARW
jgi:transcriptional regulator with XRE-family HTH domain